MRKMRILLLLILVAIGVHIGIYGHRMGWYGPVGKDAGEQTAQKPDARQPDAVRPSFDIVRAEPSGEVVMAGRAEPDWTVSIQSNGETVGTAKADANGEWIIQPNKPLARGEHSLELNAQDPTGRRTVYSKQRIALSLSEQEQGRPLVALTEEGKPPRVLQTPVKTANAGTGGSLADMGAAAKQETTADPASPINFVALDYEEVGQKSMLHATGRAAPGARVMLYIDNEFAGAATADARGQWSLSGNRVLTAGGHDIRADMVDAEQGKVVARAEVKFDHQPRQEVAAVEDKTVDGGFSAGTADREADAGASQGTAKKRTRGGREVVIVRRGDTLWQIARRYYGDGTKYTKIFRNNKNQIRNPDLIYPHQRFQLP